MKKRVDFNPVYCTQVKMKKWKSETNHKRKSKKKTQYKIWSFFKEKVPVVFAHGIQGGWGIGNVQLERAFWALPLSSKSASHLFGQEQVDNIL